MKKLKEFIEDNEGSETTPKKKTPFRDFIEGKEDLSFKLDGTKEGFFVVEDNHIKYESETGDFVPILEANPPTSKDGPIRVVSFYGGINWRYLDEMSWNTLRFEDSKSLSLNENLLEYRTKQNWAKINISKNLLPGEAGLPGHDGKHGKDGKDGEKGLVGKTGKSGEQGLQGEKGVPGRDGEDGQQGVSGKPGEDGINGSDGIDGLPGKDGKDGKRGPLGFNGSDGVDGKDGKVGKTGKSGTDGESGIDGLPGSDGADGKSGKDGVDGKDGGTGKTGKAGKIGLDGKDGADGKDGEVGPQGSQGPEGTPGKTTYVKEDVVIEEGAQGIQGQQGEQGIQGESGSDGKDGKDGADGKRGPGGIDGHFGRDGKDGREVELKSEGRAIYWKYEDEEGWKLLLDAKVKTEVDRFKDILKKSGSEDLRHFDTVPQASLLGGSGIIGQPGATGPGVTMRIKDGVFQWKQLTSHADWIDLISIDEILSKAVTSVQTINDIEMPLVVMDNNGDIVTAI
jgi:hypothetical protein